MALQKRRMGRSRIHHRRSAWARNSATSPLVGKCPGCGAPRVPHRVCMACGKYDGEQIFEVAATDEE